jgi:hypothetical protein
MVRRWIPFGFSNPSRLLAYRHSEVHEKRLLDGATIPVRHGDGYWMGPPTPVTLQSNRIDEQRDIALQSASACQTASLG